MKYRLRSTISLSIKTPSQLTKSYQNMNVDTTKKNNNNNIIYIIFKTQLDLIKYV